MDWKTEKTAALVLILTLVAAGCGMAPDLENKISALSPGSKGFHNIEVGKVTRKIGTAPGGVRALYLDTTATTAYEGKYLQADEPIKNYCGPTAGKNLLYWYGIDPSYSSIAKKMQTNTWENGGKASALCGTVCSAEPICTGLCISLLTSRLKAGTLPADARKALEHYAPAGYEVRSSSGKRNIGLILEQLLQGNPVMALESTGEDNLHWVVVTGAFIDQGKLALQVANGTKRYVETFLDDWSISKVGGKTVRSIFERLGLEPYTMIYLARSGMYLDSHLSTKNGVYPRNQRIGWGKGVHQHPTLVGDFDGDGDSDLAFIFQHWQGKGLTIRLALSKGDGSWANAEKVLGWGKEVHSYPTQVGDFDLDGDSDLAFVHPHGFQGLTISLARSRGNGDWAASKKDILWEGYRPYFYHPIYPTLVGDFDGDGGSDLAFTFQHWNGNGLTVLFASARSHGRWVTSQQLLGEGQNSVTHPAHAGDINSDGRADLIFVGRN